MSPTRVGQVRPSQLLYTYGPGALVDLPHLSVLVTGIDRWPQAGPLAPEVVEPRLLAAVRAVLGPEVSSLRRPPHLAETPNPFDEWARVGVPVATFPSWLRCPACDRVGRAGPPLFELRPSPYRPDSVSYRHTNCQRVRAKAPPAVPVRFVLACPEGHLDDFPFSGFVHRGPACAGPILELFERGHSSGADDVLVHCSACGASRSMVNAFGHEARQSLPACRGRHPHLETWEATPCPTPVRTLLLGASNSWFSVSLRALAVPQAAGALDQLVADHWADLADIASPEMLAYALAHVEAVAPLSAHDPERVWQAVQDRRSGGAGDDDGRADLHGPEWAHLSVPDPSADHEDWKVRPVTVPSSFGWLIDQVVLVERLREAVALVGFTRVDPPEEPEPGDRPASLAPLGRGRLAWVPCTEVRGEGVFVQLREEVIAAWEARVVTDAHLDALQRAHHDWRVRRRRDPGAGWWGPRYLALHTLSHLLMREAALECGYGSAAIRERLYARGGDDPMAGILLYTAAPDSEGTLGGLVSLGEPESLERLLRQALARAQLCASDPMCAEHLPSPDDVSLHGAACHACLFAPETSCERANRYLDRTLVVDTFARAGLGLFEPRGTGEERLA